MPPLDSTGAPARTEEAAEPVFCMPDVHEVLENTTDCVAMVDDAWNFTFLNSAARACLGLRSALAPMPLPSLFEAERESDAWLQTRRAAATREPAHFEFFGSRLGKWIEVHVHPLRSGMQIFFRDITERMAAKMALMESEERLRLALEAVQDGAWDWDLVAGRFSLATRMVETMGYGQAPLRVSAASFASVIRREDEPAVRAALIAHLKGRSDSFSCEFRTRAVDGSWRWVLVRGRVVARNPLTGRALRMLGISSDITERKHAEGTFLEYTNLLALAEEAAGAGAWSFDPSTSRTTLSPRGWGLLGLSPGNDTSLAYDRWGDIVHVEDQRNAAAALKQALAGAGEYSVEYRVRSGNGGWRWIHSLGRLLSDAGAGTARLIGLMLDVTDRKAAAEALAVSEQRLRLALDGAGDGAWDWWIATGEVHRSARLLEHLGYSLGTFEPNTRFLLERIHPEDLPDVLAAERNYIEGRCDAYVAEYRLRGANGEWFWILDRGRAVDWDPKTGKPVRVVGTASDITARKRAELDLHRVQGELIHLARLNAMGAMASTLAHELNQPLTAISNYVRGIRHCTRHLAGEEVLNEAVDRLEGSARRAGEIVRRLRDHVTRGELERRPVSISAIIREACELAFLDKRSAEVECRVELDAEHDRILADKIQIEQVLLNLIRNSIEAMAEGGGERQLTITSRAAGSHLELSVQDSGPGIAPEMVPDLFTAFVSGKSDGMGVGLSICRTIIEAHNGRIWSAPAPARGALMLFTLPLA